MVITRPAPRRANFLDMKKDTNVSPYLQKSTKDFLSKFADKPNTAAGLILESFPYLYNYTLRELRGYFTENELNGLVSSYNGTMMTEQFLANPAAFLMHIDDSEEFEFISKQFEFDFAAFRAKCEKLTAGQVYVLLLEINRFWNVPAAYGSPSPDLKKFYETTKK